VADVTRTCSRCGTQADGPEEGLPPGWSFGVEPGVNRITYTCPACVRANIRAIEGKLPEEYWDG
jgi:hypothetical protein